jgi:hypothetical protein
LRVLSKKWKIWHLSHVREYLVSTRSISY